MSGLCQIHVRSISDPYQIDVRTWRPTARRQWLPIFEHKALYEYKWLFGGAFWAGNI